MLSNDPKGGIGSFAQDVIISHHQSYSAFVNTVCKQPVFHRAASDGVVSLKTFLPKGFDSSLLGDESLSHEGGSYSGLVDVVSFVLTSQVSTIVSHHRCRFCGSHFQPLNCGSYLFRHLQLLGVIGWVLFILRGAGSEI